MTPDGWRVLRTGIRQSTRYPGLLAGLLGLSLATGLLLALLPTAALVPALGHRPALGSTIDGVDAWLVLEILTTSLTDATLGGKSAAPELANALPRLLLVGMFVLLALPVLSWLVTALVTGGVVLIYYERPKRLHWRRVLWGCWHWFGPFLLLGVGQTLVSVVLIGPLSAAVLAIGLSIGWLLWISLPLLALVIALFRGLFEWTRIIAVVTHTRHVGRAFSSAARLVARHPGDLASVYGLALILLIAPYALYRWVLVPFLPPERWFLVFGAQQTFVLVWLWVRLARLAGGTALAAEWLSLDQGNGGRIRV
jgi:hypothetical protein